MGFINMFCYLVGDIMMLGREGDGVLGEVIKSISYLIIKLLE